MIRANPIASSSSASLLILVRLRGGKRMERRPQQYNLTSPTVLDQAYLNLRREFGRVPLREQLRCKEIWVVGANRYRNPDEDVPADCETQRTAYYQALNLPLEADRFVCGLQ
jgi:hypothetical protein